MLVDGSSYLYRAFHALPELRSPKTGEPTGAIYGVLNMLRKLATDYKPAALACVFDARGRTFRDAEYADYKANRTPMPSDLAEQIPWVHEACEALGVPIITSERYEADDVIGTLALKAAAAGFEVGIVTGDKDFFQLVHGGITVYNPRDDGTWFDAGGVKEKFGVTPSQVVDVLALMGDSIDNIKGVPGIGEKGARDLIAQYGSLEELLRPPPFPPAFAWLPGGVGGVPVLPWSSLLLPGGGPAGPPVASPDPDGEGTGATLPSPGGESSGLRSRFRPEGASVPSSRAAG